MQCASGCHVAVQVVPQLTSGTCVACRGRHAVIVDNDGVVT